MNSKLTIIGNILLTLCLLFTFTFSNAIPASAKKSKQDISIEVYSDNDILFELVAKNTDRDAAYSVTILQKGNQYLWKSKIDVDGKTVSKTEFKIKKIKRDFEPKELEKHLSNVLLGKEDSNELEEYINKVFDIQEEKTELNNQGKVTTQAVPLLIPLAAGAISSSALATLEAALFATVATATAAVATAILEERYRYSDETAEVRTRDTYVDNWSDFTEIPNDRATSATRHIELAGVNEIVNRINRDRNNDGDLEIFVSTTDIRGSVLLVYDINSALRTTVNRHLGNYVEVESV